ncbi:MAG: hypothetical protein EXR69_05070 [Myxococcales bacterium]|nr:hypothetical protein [Myxococcales bacterium]
MPTLYWKSTCTTCRDVRSALVSRPGVGSSIVDRNYAKNPLTLGEIRAIIAAGGVPTLLNATHATSKERGWKTSPPDDETFAMAAHAEPNLLRRPILLVGDRAWVHRACLDATL